MKNKAVISAVVLLIVFLAGFVPQYAKVNQLDAELRQARQASASAELRDLAGLAYVQANQKNYGIAAGTTARFFTRVREVANQTPDAGARKIYEDLLISRDKITAELAKGDAGVMGDLQDLFVRTRKATGAASEQ
jgi:outer membrane murein-binding lipoprotein Lpp